MAECHLQEIQELKLRRDYIGFVDGDDRIDQKLFKHW